MLSLMRIVPFYLLLLFFVGCSESKEGTVAKAEELPLNVDVHTLKKEPYPLWIYFTGKTQAIDEVDVISRVKGELLSTHFKPGQPVHKGNLLFGIDKSEYQAVYDQKYAILQKDKASYALAKANVARYTPLVKEQLAPREKLDELTATLKQLEATIKADEAALKNARLDLEYCDIKASIDGQIGKPLILQGNLIKAGDVLAKIVRTDRLYVNFNPSAHEVALIKRYSKKRYPDVKVSLRGDGNITQPLTGQIDFIDNVSSSSTGTVAMRAVVENSEGLVFPGSFVKIELFLGEYDVLAIHPDQISQDQLGQYVHLVDANNTVHITHLKPIFSNNDLVLIGQDLKAGDRVVVGTFNGLVEGMKVTPKEVPNPIKVK